jgi:hypothetical protein
MSHQTDDFEIDLALTDANRCCLDAIAGLDWKLQSAEPELITIKSGMGLTSWPSRVEIRLRTSNDQRTLVLLAGSIGGFGPIQKGHLRRRMTGLRDAIVARAHKTPGTFQA